MSLSIHPMPKCFQVLVFCRHLKLKSLVNCAFDITLHSFWEGEKKYQAKVLEQKQKS